MSALFFIIDSLITTLVTLLLFGVLYLLVLYVVGACILTRASFKYGLKKLVWINPLNLLKYAGTKVTIHMGSGDLIIDYFGYFPKVVFIAEQPH